MAQLYDYGILNEESDYRVHVCFGEGHVYLFSTQAGKEVCLSGRYPKRKAYQPGINGATANGYIVPPMTIKGCKRVVIPPAILAALDCKKTETTTQKGNKAVECVKHMFIDGMLPISIETKFVSEKDIQIKGIDIIVISKTKIEVKCDYDGGVNGTGNLYLQVAERNPLRAY